MSAPPAESLNAPSAAGFGSTATVSVRAGAESDPSQSPSDAAAERSGQPHHFHAGPNPPATSDAHSAHRAPPAPAVCLYRHALESVFAFLSQSELAFALRVARGWLGAVRSMGRMDLAVRSQPSAPLDVVARSAMGRHIGAMHCESLDDQTLAVVAGRMAHLRTLICALELRPSDEPLAFPAGLQKLQVHLSDPDVAAAIAAIVRLPLLEELGIRPLELAQQISFAPLAALPLLRRLQIYRRSPWNGDLSDAQVDELRALPQLQQLHVDMTVPLLRRLLRQPHHLQWQQISLPDTLEDETAALLPQLPSLTTIMDGWAECSRFDWLHGLPNLAHVHLSIDSAGAAGAPTESLVAALPSCTNIEILSLRGFDDLTAAQLADLLPRLPRLRELNLLSLEIDSLAFLALPPLANHLTALVLWYCCRLPPAELRHVHGLRGLTTLQLSYSFTADLDERDRAQLTPPSAVLPQLVKFEYAAVPAG